MEFHVYLNGAERGPFTEGQVRAYLAEGLLQPSDLVSNQAGANWKTLANFISSTEQPPPPKAAPSIRPPLPDLPRVAPQSPGPFARSTLAPNETPRFRTSLHWLILVRFAFLALLVFLVVAIPFAIGVQALTASERGWFVLPLPAFIVVPAVLAYLRSELVITDGRILIKTGIVRPRVMEMFISGIESIAIDQGFFGRMLDYGTVTIRGTGGSVERFTTVAHPIEFRNWVQRLQHGGDSSTTQ